MRTLKHEIQGDISILTLDRPEVLNALNVTVLEKLQDVLSQSHRVVILTGSESKAFIAGADIEQMLGMDEQEMLNFLELGQHVANLIERSPFISIAAVNGYALGGGLEMALACDFIFASENAQFGFPEVTLGLIPGFGGTQRLTKAIGKSRAKELILSGKKINAAQAQDCGLVNKVIPQETLIDACIEWANQLLKNSHEAMIKAKEAINFALNENLEEGLLKERKMCAQLSVTKETKKLLSNFLAKRGSHA